MPLRDLLMVGEEPMDDEPVVLFDETHHFLPSREPELVFRQPTPAESLEALGRAWRHLADEVNRWWPTVPVVEFARQRLDSWIEPPPSVMERALQAQRNRNTGPTRPTGQSAHRPRRH